MAHVILNRVAVRRAATAIGIVDRQGLSEHLGMDISEPASPQLVSTIVTRLSITMSMAFFFIAEAQSSFPTVSGVDIFL